MKFKTVTWNIVFYTYWLHTDVIMDKLYTWSHNQVKVTRDVQISASPFTNIYYVLNIGKSLWVKYLWIWCIHFRRNFRSLFLRDVAVNTAIWFLFHVTQQWIQHVCEIWPCIYISRNFWPGCQLPSGMAFQCEEQQPSYSLGTLVFHHYLDRKWRLFVNCTYVRYARWANHP